MNILDVNILLYAVDEDSPQHERAKGWLDDLLGSGAVVGFPWHSIVSFLRIATSSAVLENPLSPGEARRIVSLWLSSENSSAIMPTASHWEILGDLIESAQCRGNLISDAHLASLAIEHGATLCSTDMDFSRFPGLKWVNPLAQNMGS